MVGGGAFLTMWTQGQVYVLHTGQSVALDCEFYSEHFNMFKNPVVWKKHQRQEMTEINIMGNILPPFLATGRFVVTFDKNPPRYHMILRITGTFIMVLSLRQHKVSPLVLCDIFMTTQSTACSGVHYFHLIHSVDRCPS